MKRMLSVLMIFSCLLLTGCSDHAENIHINARNTWNDGSTNIKVDKKYTLRDYKKEYTEDGCAVIIYYELSSENDK